MKVGNIQLKVGLHMIEDLYDPKPEEIDLKEIDIRLRLMHRFSNDPKALSVHQHRNLAALLATYAGARREVIDWCLHHDDHEAFTGDIPGPVKRMIGRETGVLMQLEERLDRAICKARGKPYPDLMVRLDTLLFDKAAETVEWVHHMGNPLAHWNAPTPPGMDEAELKAILWEARQAP